MTNTYKIRPMRCKLVADGKPMSVAKNRLDNARDAALVLSAYYARESLPHERVVALLLNTKNDVIGLARIAEGGICGCALTPADVLRPVIAAGAYAFILAHNHPSGDPEPSLEDRMMTERVREAADLVGTQLLDSIVIGACGSYRRIVGDT